MKFIIIEHEITYKIMYFHAIEIDDIVIIMVLENMYTIVLLYFLKCFAC